MLAFSPVGIRHCDVSIGDDFSAEATQVTDNLFVAPWDPTKYHEGLYRMSVRCVDKDGRKVEV